MSGEREKKNIAFLPPGMTLTSFEEGYSSREWRKIVRARRNLVTSIVRGFHRVTKWCCCIVLGIVLAGISAPDTVLTPLSRFLVWEREIPRADAIVVLLGQNNSLRTRAAAKLFLEGKARTILMVSGYHGRPWYSFRKPGIAPWIPGGWEYRNRLIEHGVPSESIELLHSTAVFDTSSELTVLSEIVRARGLDSVALVSSASHTRRLGLIWERVGLQSKFGVYGASRPVLERWWTSQDGRWIVFYEYGALAKEFLRRPFVRGRGEEV